MKKTLILGGAAAALLLAAAGAYFFAQQEDATATFIAPTDQAVIARGKTIYTSQCAACHGAQLEGQAAWRQRLPNGRLPAPPHDPSGHTWHHPDAVLIDIVKNGLVPGKSAPDGYESDMPAYGKILPDDEIVAVLAYIKSTWPADILALQKKVTLQQDGR